MKKALLILTLLVPLNSALAADSFQGKGIWIHPGDMGKSEADVEKFFKLLDKCGFNLVFPLVKGTGGTIFWHSQKFPEAVHADYTEFDLLRAAVKYAHQYGIKIHPWLCDFPEGKNSPAFKQHPEWAMLNPQGGYTSDEKLSQDRPYNPVWMCPARRPGYTDQWLIPMIEEIVENYDVDGIHHDYVRYPGDVAPDSYCFCDYCLDHYLTYNHFYYQNRPHDQISLKKVLPREESNWHNDMTLKPPDWDKMTREEKADYLLNGKSVNRNDLDYYLYETRSDAITQFVREATERARKIKLDIEFSAAVFINPMRSARHIGQRWTDFLDWVDIMAPMNYRSHFQGTFEDYLAYLEDYIRAQMKWSRRVSLLYAGVTGHYIYREEREPWEEAINILASEDISDSEMNKLNKLMEKNIGYLKQFSPKQAKELNSTFKSWLKNEVQNEKMATALRDILRDPPAGFFPEEKLLRTIDTIRKAGADGVVIFAAGIIQRNKLWPALEKALSK